MGLLSAALLTAFLLPACGGRKPIVVGSKNFTESVILGEILAQKLEGAECKVDRRLNMGGTLVCDTSIRSGAIDTYVEYSGTALTAILKKPPMNDRFRVNELVRAEYDKAGLAWRPNLGFNNTFAMLVRKRDATEDRLQKISDLAEVQAGYQPGFGYEFVARPDGWNGLLKAYGLRFRKPPKTMDLGLTYRALAKGYVDLIAGNSTDGLIESLGLTMLRDNLFYFPPYDAAVVARSDINRKCKRAREVLDSLEHKIDDATMRRLNYEVDGRKRDVAVVVREFLNPPKK